MTQREEELLKENELLKEKLRLLEEQNRLQAQEIRLLTEKVNLLVARLFGQKSEKLDPNQLQLLLGLQEETRGEEEASPTPEVEEAVTPAKASKPRRPRIPENLPVEERVLIPPEVQDNPDGWRRIGEEVTEQLDYEPGRFLKKRTVRPTFVSREQPDEAPITAELPERLIEKGMYGSGLMTEIIIGKYAHHLPLDRQEKIFKRQYGVDVPRQSMSRMIDQVADSFQLIVEEMIRQQFASGAVQVDETPIRYLEPGHGKTKQGYMWATHVPGGDTVYHWGPERSAACLGRIIPGNFTGTLQCDGYSAYPAFRNDRKGVITLAGCWAHARRGFCEALEVGEHKGQCAWMLRQIQLLYEVERRLRGSRAGPSLRQAIRASESQPILRRIKKAALLLQSRTNITPSSRLGKALTYLLNQWAALEVPLTDGRLEIDNNSVENAIRPSAVGKKNWLFIGAKDAGKKSAILYSLIISCRNHGVDPRAYIKYLIDTLPRLTNQQIKNVTPAAYAGRRIRSAA
jgi:transposase